MRSISRMTMAAALLASLTLAAPAHALAYASCAATYTASTVGKACTFTPVGANLGVSGYSNIYSGYVHVRITDPTGNATILRCTGSSQCSAEVGLPSTPTDSVGPPASEPLTCQILEGAGGSFGCWSHT